MSMRRRSSTTCQAAAAASYRGPTATSPLWSLDRSSRARAGRQVFFPAVSCADRRWGPNWPNRSGIIKPPYPAFSCSAGPRQSPAHRSSAAARPSGRIEILVRPPPRNGPSLASLEWTGFALLGKCPSGLVEILAKVKFQRLRLHIDLAGELLQIPASGAHGGAHTQRRILVDLVSQCARDIEISVLWRYSVDEPSVQRLFGGEETPGQCHLRSERRA